MGREEVALVSRSKKSTYPMYNSRQTEQLDTDGLSNEAGLLVRGLLEKDPKKRLSSIKQIKKHPFFASIHWSDVENHRLTPAWVPRPYQEPKHILGAIPEDRFKIVDSTPVPEFTWTMPVHTAAPIHRLAPEVAQSPPYKPLPSEPLCKSVSFALPRQHPYPSPSPSPSADTSLSPNPSPNLTPSRPRPPPPRRQQLPYTHTSPMSIPTIQQPQTIGPVPLSFICKLLSIILPRPWVLYLQDTDTDTEGGTTIVHAPRGRYRHRIPAVLPHHVHDIKDGDDRVLIHSTSSMHGTTSSEPPLSLSFGLASLVEHPNAPRALRRQNSADTLVDSIHSAATESVFGSTASLVKRPAEADVDFRLGSRNGLERRGSERSVVSQSSHTKPGLIRRLFGWLGVGKSSGGQGAVQLA